MLVVAPPWYPVPPAGYGGIELVVDLLVRGLRARGWRVSLIAAEGSPGATPCAPAAWQSDLGRPTERLRELSYAARVVRQVDALPAVDVIHDHVGFASLLALGLAADAPVVHTVHGPIGEPEATFLGSLPRSVGLVAISASQRSEAPELPWLAMVHNAVDVGRLVAVRADEKDSYLLCLARICAEKGQHLAIEVAERAGMRLVLAGKVDSSPSGRRYFDEKVRPRIDGDRVHHVDDVGGVEKALLLARAKALLAPIQWDEPFGLAVVEAMASGTPAISMTRGAAPELIEDGLTGFLVRDVDGMTAALGRLAEIDPELCAARARTRFSPHAMVDGYIRAYESACTTWSRRAWRADLPSVAVGGHNTALHGGHAAS